MDRIYRDDGHHPPHSRHPFVPRHKRPKKKWDPEKLYEAVKKIIARELAYAMKRGSHLYVVFAEKVEDELHASVSDVTKTFMRLNREGYLSQKHRYFAHDSSRDPMFGFQGWSGWAANVYDINSEKFVR